MGRDRSLDEFFGGDGDADDDPSESDADTGSDAADGGTNAGADADGGGGDDGPDGEARPEAAAVDSATPTYRWAPEGAACESCGTVVERRWVDDGAFVCDDCKRW